MPLWLLTILKSPLARYVAVTVLLFVWAYSTGRSDCVAKHQRRATQEAQALAKRIDAAETAAYERGLQAARQSAANKEKANEIGRVARKEPGADDICISADVLDRLRDIN